MELNTYQHHPVYYFPRCHVPRKGLQPDGFKVTAGEDGPWPMASTGGHPQQRKAKPMADPGCVSCDHERNQNTKFMLERLDAWTMAYNALKAPEREWGDYVVDASDVAGLAMFLSGVIGGGD